jgi:hypothetical protein
MARADASSTWPTPLPSRTSSAWAQLRHPADRTALFIGNHGFGWTGFGISWSYAKSFMYVPDLAHVLREARTPVDCLFFDACLMNMAEVVTELGDSHASHLLASETYGQTEWPYGWLLEGLQASPGWSPLEFATDVNERLWTYYSVSNVVPGITLCTSDLSLVPALASNTARFVAAVLDMNIPIGEVRTRATDVMESIDDLLIVRRMGSDWNDIAHGLAVYFPLKDGLAAPQSFSEYTFRRTRFALDAGWRGLLDAYYDPMSHPPFHGELMSSPSTTARSTPSRSYLKTIRRRPAVRLLLAQRGLHLSRARTGRARWKPSSSPAPTSSASGRSPATAGTSP